MAFSATESNCYALAKRSPTDVTKGYGSKQGGYSLPPGDCKASNSILDPAAPFVKQVIEPVATIFVVCGTGTGKMLFRRRGQRDRSHCEEQSDDAIPEAKRLLRSTPNDA